MSWVDIGVSLPNGREHSQCHGWTLVYHCPMVENIVNVRLGIGVSLPNGREHSQCHGWALVYHCPIIENIVNDMVGNWCSMINCPMSWLGIGHWCIIAQW